MNILIVVENPKLLTLEVPGAEVVSARKYVTDRRFVDLKRAKVFNLCRTYGYQTLGYYVSLLAAARGHKPMPSVTTIQDLRQAPVLRIVSDDLEELVRSTFATITEKKFELSIYFGKNPAKRYDRLCQALFQHFPAPLLRAEFVHVDHWRIDGLRPIATNDIPECDHPFVKEQAQRFFARPRVLEPDSRKARYDLAILVNPTEIDAPSDERALKGFIRAARKLGIAAWLIDKDDFGRLGEYDALFIRESTYVDHHTFRFAARAEAEGLVVIDDPESIVRCTNKVYQAELFDRNNVRCPKTLVVHKDNAADVGKQLGFPCVLKRPDSSFSAGVVKANNDEELVAHLKAFFDKSELVVAQEFVPSTFDWRVGVLDGKPLYVCKYFMARGHWQIQKAHGARRTYGKVETLAVQDAPDACVSLAVRAARLIGDGLYGVDIKEVDGRFLVMEINDNPSIEAGYEDAVLKDDLYLLIMQSFSSRLEQRVQGRSRP